MTTAHDTTIFSSFKKHLIYDEETSIENVFHIIKNEHHKIHVNAARAAGKHTDRKLYDRIKGRVLAFTPHGAFKGKNNKDLVQLSGLIYIDLDDQVVDLEKIKAIPSLYACWKSLSGLGYSLLFRAENYTANQINSVIQAVAKEHGISLDESAKALNRAVCISSDPDLYYNPAAVPFVYTHTEEETITENDTFSDAPISRAKAVKKSTTTKDGKLYMNVAELGDMVKPLAKTYEFAEGEIYHLLPEPVRVMEEIYRKRISVGNRYKIMKLTAAKLVAFYSQFSESSEKQVYGEFLTFNKLCQEPLEQGELQRIFRTVIKESEAGKLMVPTVLKYGIINPAMPEAIKKAAAGMIGGEVKKKKTEQTIAETILILQADRKKITQKAVAETIGKHISTIKRYWPQMKELLKAGKEVKLMPVPFKKAA